MTAQQLQHMSAWEAIGEASLLRLPSPHLEKKKQPYTGYLVLLPWRWGVLVIGAHAVTGSERNRGLRVT